MVEIWLLQSQLFTNSPLHFITTVEMAAWQPPKCCFSSPKNWVHNPEVLSEMSATTFV
jgi:hypothetical protein